MDESLAETFASLEAKLYDVKDKMTNGEYLAIMTNVQTIYDKWSQREDFVDDEDEEGSCRGHTNTHQFCTDSIEAFLNCDNLNAVLNRFPILEIVLDYYYDCTNSTNIQLQTRISDGVLNNVNYIKDDVECLIKLCSAIHIKIGKYFIAMQVYEHLLANFTFVTHQQTLFGVLWKKLTEHEAVVFDDPNDDPNVLVGIMAKVGVTENPFTLIKSTFCSYIEELDVETRERYGHL